MSGEVDPPAPDSTQAAKKESGSSTKIKRDGPENRNSQRFRIEDTKTEMYLHGILTRLGINRKNEARVAVNLSEGGVMVSTHEKIPRGTKVKIRIEMEKFKDVIEAEGVVRWSYASARNSSEFYSGVQFVNLAPSDLAKIVRMRTWFTSPEYRAKSATRRRTMIENEPPPDPFQLM
jgi:hypothetical protein